MNTKQPILGIMICETGEAPQFAEKDFFRELTLYGLSQNITVYVFSPKKVQWAQNTVKSYRYEPRSNRWISETMPLPTVIYDRCFYSKLTPLGAYKAPIQRLKNKGIPFLGYGLKGKWEVHQILQNHPQLRSYLPPTQIYHGYRQIEPYLKQGMAIVLKPRGGSQGVGIYRLQHRANQLDILGRNEANQNVHYQIESAKIQAWLKRNVRPQRYVLQKYLELTSTDNRSFDIRSLVQKGHGGKWSHVGMAARVGQKGSLTSNLHGGGDVYGCEEFIKSNFPNKANQILAELNKLSYDIPPVLEQLHGRLVEVGIDFGIDRQGNVWVIEVNSKPGRNVFKEIKDDVASKEAVANLIRYAKHIIERK